MLNIRLICVGKLKEDYWRQAVNEYSKRLSRYAKCEIIEIDEHKVPDNPSIAEIQAAMKAEGEHILAKLKGAAVSLCIEGEKLSSEGFAAMIKEMAVSSQGTISFVIGGSWGLDEQVKKASAKRISFSDMTFPHQMMRVILLEQIYRAMQINEGGKYHK